MKVFFSEQTGEAIIVKLGLVSVNSQWVGNSIISQAEGHVRVACQKG